MGSGAIEMLASHANQSFPRNYQRKQSPAPPALTWHGFLPCSEPSPVLSLQWCCRSGSLHRGLPKVLMHSGKMKLTSVFYLLMSNHHLYLSLAWISAAWNTNAIRNCSLFRKTHTHLAKSCLTDVCKFLGFLGNAIAWYEPLDSCLPYSSMLQHLGTWVRTRSLTWLALDLTFQLTQCEWSDKSFLS